MRRLSAWSGLPFSRPRKKERVSTKVSASRSVGVTTTHGLRRVLRPAAIRYPRADRSTPLREKDSRSFLRKSSTSLQPVPVNNKAGISDSFRDSILNRSFISTSIGRVIAVHHDPPGHPKKMKRTAFGLVFNLKLETRSFS